MAVATTFSFQMFMRHNAVYSPSENILLHHFECMRLVIVITKEFIGKQALHTIVFSQVLLTIAAWLCINCYRFLPVHFIATMAAAFIGCLGTAVFLLTIMANAGIVSGEIIQRKRAQFSKSLCRNGSNDIYLRLKWIAQQPILVYCGTHFVVDKDVVMNFINVLMGNVTNNQFNFTNCSLKIVK